jgi:hypothetical protein
VAGALEGAGLAWFGALFPTGSRAALASLLAVVGLAVGTASMLGRRIRLLQINHETSQRLMGLGPYWWASINGAALGAGGFSRIGFALWYVLPVGALVSAEPPVGIALLGTYGLVRTAAVAIFLVGESNDVDLAQRFLEHRPAATDATAAFLIVISLMTAVGIGL